MDHFPRDFFTKIPYELFVRHTLLTFSLFQLTSLKRQLTPPSKPFSTHFFYLTQNICGEGTYTQSVIGGRVIHW